MNKYYYDGFKNYVEMQKEAGRLRNALIGALKGGLIGSGIGTVGGGVGGNYFARKMINYVPEKELLKGDRIATRAVGTILGGLGGGVLGGGTGALIGGIRGALKKQKLTRMQKVKKALGLNY
jgi:hypothetical protein